MGGKIKVHRRLKAIGLLTRVAISESSELPILQMGIGSAGLCPSATITGCTLLREGLKSMGRDCSSLNSNLGLLPRMGKVIPSFGNALGALSRALGGLAG